MIQVAPNSRILVANEPVSFRSGLNGFCGICRTILGEDPLSGTYYVFTNKAKNSIRILLFDGDGLWLMTKVFAKGRLPQWPDSSGKTSVLDSRKLLLLIWRGDLAKASLPELWKKIS
jgi:transposase